MRLMLIRATGPGTDAALVHQFRGDSTCNPRGRRYRAEIYRDGEGADWKTAPSDIVMEQRQVTAADTLSLRLAAGGGQAIRFTPIDGETGARGAGRLGKTRR